MLNTNNFLKKTSICPFQSFINKTQSKNAKHPYWQEIEIKSEEENVEDDA